jgi:hypothetical protein
MFERESISAFRLVHRHESICPGIYGILSINQQKLLWFKAAWFNLDIPDCIIAVNIIQSDSTNTWGVKSICSKIDQNTIVCWKNMQRLCREKEHGSDDRGYKKHQNKELSK